MDLRGDLEPDCKKTFKLYSKGLTYKQVATIRSSEQSIDKAIARIERGKLGV